MIDALPDPDWYLDYVVVPGGPDHEPVGPVRTWQAGWLARARSMTQHDDAALRLAARQGFVITPAQVRATGMSPAEMRRLVSRGEWCAARHGVVGVIPLADDVRPALAATAAALVRPGHVISHRSAAVLHGLPLLEPPGIPELTGRTRTTVGRRYHVAIRQSALSAAEIGSWFGAPVTSLARTVIDLARNDRRAGLVATDAALHERVVSADDLVAAARRCSGWPGARAAREIVTLASSLAESPLESLTRLCVLDAGLPTPQLQVRITDPRDGWRCRVDLLWPEQRVVLEADGKIKYTDAVIWREKRRQVRLERLGYRVLRAIWADVSQPRELLADLRLYLGLPR